MSLGLIGYILRDWRHVQITVSVPTLLLITYIYFVPESPRWLVCKNRIEHAIMVCKRAAKINHLPSDEIENDIRLYRKEKFRSKAAIPTCKIFFTNSKFCRYWIFISLNWFSYGASYIGISHVMGAMSGNVFLNIVISGSACIPGTLFGIIGMKYLGRKVTLLLSNSVSALPFIIMAFIQTQMSYLRIILACTGLCGLSILSSCIYIYTAEIFPTAIRATAVGTASMLSKAGSLSTTLILLLPNKHMSAPLFFGILLLISGFLNIFLPETWNCVLPELIKETESFKSVSSLTTLVKERMGHSYYKKKSSVDKRSISSKDSTSDFYSNIPDLRPSFNVFPDEEKREGRKKSSKYGNIPTELFRPPSRSRDDLVISSKLKPTVEPSRISQKKMDSGQPSRINAKSFASRLNVEPSRINKKSHLTVGGTKNHLATNKINQKKRKKISSKKTTNKRSKNSNNNK